MNPVTTSTAKSYRLPNIRIYSAIAPVDFLRKLETKAAASGRFTLKRRTVGKKSLLELELGGSDLVGQIIVDPSKPRSVDVEIRSSSWNSSRPDYGEYARSATIIFKDLLNSLCPPHQLRIDKKSKCEPTLSERAHEYFQAFVCIARLTLSMNNDDWQRFYKFVKYCHERHIELTPPELEWLLEKERMGEQLAKKLADVYRHGRSILAVKLKREEEWERLMCPKCSHGELRQTVLLDRPIEYTRCRNSKCDYKKEEPLSEEKWKKELRRIYGRSFEEE